MSNLTVHVTDTAAAVKRLKKAGARPLGKGPTALPKSLAEGVFLTVVPDPDGNLVVATASGDLTVQGATAAPRVAATVVVSMMPRASRAAS